MIVDQAQGLRHLRMAQWDLNGYRSTSVYKQQGSAGTVRRTVQCGWRASNKNTGWRATVTVGGGYYINHEIWDLGGQRSV
jgi:hypothetical protein